MLAPRTSRRMSSNSSTSSLRDIPPSNSLLFKGLPLRADNNYILSFMSVKHIARGDEEQPLISFFPIKDDQKYRNCKISYVSIEKATFYLNRWNKECPPRSTNKLTVCYWKEEKVKNESQTTSATVKPSNSILIQGLPEDICLGHILFFVGGNIVRGRSDQPLVQIFPAKNGYRSARVILTSIAEARRFIEENNNKPLQGYNNRLTIKYYADKKANGPKYDEEVARRVRQAAAAVSKSILIKGLFEKRD